MRKDISLRGVSNLVINIRFLDGISDYLLREPLVQLQNHNHESYDYHDNRSWEEKLCEIVVCFSREFVFVLQTWKFPSFGICH